MYFGSTGTPTRQEVITYGGPSGSVSVTQNPPFTSALLPYCHGDLVYVSSYYTDTLGGSSSVAIYNESATPVATKTDNGYVIDAYGVTTGSGLVLVNYTVP